MIKLAVFDMAGTTVDEDNVVYKTIQKSLGDYGFDFTLAKILANAAGKEKLQAIQDLLEQYDEENEVIASAIHRDFVLALETAYETLAVKTFPSTLKVFQGLRKKEVKIVLNTGYDYPVASNLLEKLNWKIGKTIDGLVTASDVKNNRPAPDMILLAMQQMGITDPKMVFKVGDSGIDIEEGKNAGCGLTFGVTTGAQTRAQLLEAQPDYVVDSLVEILEYL